MSNPFLHWLLHGDHPEGQNAIPTRRQQLLEARTQVLNQIWILQNPIGYPGRPDNASLIADLTITLDEIEANLEDMGPADD